MTNHFRYFALVMSIVALATAMPVGAQEPVDTCRVGYYGGLTINAGSGDFAPYYIMSNRFGTLTQAGDALLHAGVERRVDLSKRFSWGFCAEGWAGVSASTDYARYDAATERWHEHSEHPSNVWLQQLYAQVKWRGVFLMGGMKEYGSALLDNRLSSGDLTHSANARPIPQVRAGFVDFQDIPFTNGWLQIEGCIAYGWMTDSNWWEDHCNDYNWHYTRDECYTYKRAYFRTKPSERLSVTFGAQCAGVFGGKTYYYSKGQLIKTESHPHGFKDYWEMFIPKLNSGEGFVKGNHLGSWDLKARYRFKDDSELEAYFEWPWEDGSGMAKRNGWDGLWGLRYTFAKQGWLKSVVVEYLDFTNQSGPIHWEPGDSPGTDLTDKATGRDDYYNNNFYNSYANYGMGIGTPFLPAPIYNQDGYLGYLYSSLRGFHIGACGSINSLVDWRLLGGYRKSWGSTRIPLTHTVDCTSMMAEATWRVPSVKGLQVTGQVAFDAGSMLDDHFGALLSVSYSGVFR